MKIKELVSWIAKIEGKKREVSVGDVREIVGIVSDKIYLAYKESDTTLSSFITQLRLNGQRRSKRKKT